MPVFSKQLKRVDPSNPQEAIKQLYQHIIFMQEELEYLLYNLDSRNIITENTNLTVDGGESKGGR